MHISFSNNDNSNIISYIAYLAGMLVLIWLSAEFFLANYPTMGSRHIKIILISISFFVVIFTLLIIKVKNLAWLTAGSILILGLLFSILTPVNDVPDEAAHVARSMYTAEGNLLMHDDKAKLKISTSIKQIDHNFQKTVINNKLDKYKYNKKTAYTRTVTSMNSYSFISYIPQAIGINIGRLLHLNLFWIYYLGRIMNLLFYSVAIFVAIALAGKLKYIISLVALLPMNIYLAASFNQDSFAVGVIAITLGLFFRLLTDKNSKITSKQLMLFTLCCMLLIVTKLPYALLVLLLLFVPKNRFKTNKWWVLAGIGLVGIGCLLWILYYTRFTPGNRPEHVDAILQLKFMLSHPVIGGKAVVNGLISATGLVTSIFTFGWLTYASWEITIIYIITFCLIIARKPMVANIPAVTKLGIIFTSICVLALIYLSQYLTWTPIGATQIQGVQGRYFIGLLFIIPLLLESSSESADTVMKKSLNLNRMIYIAALFVVAVLVFTICRYY